MSKLSIMYPLDIFTLFPPFPRDKKVFVAMSFGGKYDEWYENVIKPAISAVSIDGSDSDDKLVPFRVDNSQSAHSINAEIIKNISSCLLFFADLTTLGYIEREGRKYPCRNNNVMYEIGLATAVRLSKEVILFKSDDDPLPLDFYDIYVNKYNPDQKDAREKIKIVLETAIKEIEIQKLWSVQRTADSLTYDCIQFLLNKKFGHSKVNLIRETGIWHGDVSGHLAKGQVILSTLLNLGIIRVEHPENNSCLFKEEIDKMHGREKYTYTGKKDYVITPFGEAVTEEIITRFGCPTNSIETNNNG